MPEVDIVGDQWRESALALADHLRRLGVITSDAWYDAVCAVPRHVFVPRFYETRADNGSVSADLVESALRRDTVYGTETLVTAIEIDTHGNVVPMSSSTKPDLMLRMLEDLDTAAGNRVLEIGTGTGYNAALLAHRLGSGNVFSIDVADQLVTTAAHRLHSAGYSPRLATLDGGKGWSEHAPYDRIIATCGVRAIPPAWMDQLANDGIILADFKPHGGNLVKLRRVGNHLEGTFRPYYGAFMVMQPEHRQDDLGHLIWQTDVTDTVRTRTTDARPDVPSVVGFLRASLFATPLRRSTKFDDDRQPSAIRLTAPDGSWCEIDHETRSDGRHSAREAGPTQVLAQLESAFAQWAAHDRPGWNRIGVTIDPSDPDGMVTWIDAPTQPLSTN